MGVVEWALLVVIVLVTVVFVVRNQASFPSRKAAAQQAMLDQSWESVIEAIELEGRVPYEYFGQVTGDASMALMDRARPAGPAQARIVVRHRRSDGRTDSLAAWEQAGPEGIAPPYEEMLQWEVGDRLVKPAGHLRPRKA